jgi:hypothetical protein
MESGHPDQAPKECANMGLLLDEHGYVEPDQAAYQQQEQVPGCVPFALDVAA